MARSEEEEEEALAVAALLRSLGERRSSRRRATLVLPALDPPEPSLPPSLPRLLAQPARQPLLSPPEPQSQLALAPAVELVGRGTLRAGALGADGVLRVSYLEPSLDDDEGEEIEVSRAMRAFRPPRELRSASLVQHADRVDVIAPAENMKAFFKLLHTGAAISLAVHCVGNTLVLEGLELDRSSFDGGAANATNAAAAGVAAEGREGGEGETPCTPATTSGRLQLARKSHHSRFLTYSLALEPPKQRVDAHDKEANVAEARNGDEAAAGIGVGVPTGDIGGEDSESAGESDGWMSEDAEAEEWMPSKRPPQGFLRTLRWQLGDLNVLLGSDTLVFRDGSSAGGVSSLDTSRSADGYASSGVSVALHDTRSDVTSLVCLDYWLDAVMSSASQVAICLHNGGVVQGYRAVPTQDLPGGGGLSADGGFSPAAVTSCAVSVLQFLRANCTREAGTYWLIRRDGGDELELYDISEIGTSHPKCADLAGANSCNADIPTDEEGAEWECNSDGGSEPEGMEHSSFASFHPFAEPVALLCWRIAERLSPSVPDEAKRRRTLLESCVSLLTRQSGGSHRQQLPMVAAAYEGLADGWLLEAHQLMPLPPVSHQPSQGGSLPPSDAGAGTGAPAREATGAMAAGGPGHQVAAGRRADIAPPTTAQPSAEALAAVAAQRNAARALLGGVRALREVCRPGATPPRLLRMLAKLARTETALARRYTLVGRAGRAVAALRRAGAAQAALSRPSFDVESGHLGQGAVPTTAAGATGGAVRAAERGYMLLTLGDACSLVARAAARPDAAVARAAVAMHAEDLRTALEDPELILPSWTTLDAGGAPASPASPSASPPSPFTNRQAFDAAASSAVSWGAGVPASSPGNPSPITPPPGGDNLGAPTLSAFASDAEGNYRLAIGFYLSAVRSVPSASLAAAHERLRDTYSRLGQYYVDSDRFTKACRHYQQGIELFRSTTDCRSAAIMAIAFGRAIRSRLASAQQQPVADTFTYAARCRSGVAVAPTTLLPAAAMRLAMAGGGSVPPPAEMAEAELQDYERCSALFEQAKTLLSSAPPAAATVPAASGDDDHLLMAEADLELGFTQLMQAARLEESLPYAPRHAEAADAITRLVADAAKRLEGGGDRALAGDARYRLALLMRREAERAASSQSASSRPFKGVKPAHGDKPVAGAAAAALASLLCAKEHLEAALHLLPSAVRPAEHVLVLCDLSAVRRCLVLPPCADGAATVPERHKGLQAALRYLLATHEVFCQYAFPLPPASPTSSEKTGPQAAGAPKGYLPLSVASMAAALENTTTNGAATAVAARSFECHPPPSSSCDSTAAAQPPSMSVSLLGGACALVATTWPVVESEMQAVLKELVKLHANTGDNVRAAKYKQLYRLSLTHRELLGTNILLRIAEEAEEEPLE